MHVTKFCQYDSAIISFAAYAYWGKGISYYCQVLVIQYLKKLTVCIYTFSDRDIITLLW